ncbi:MAG TPA: CatB-related O-acetyltransferase [Opitutaceae bacterium]|nr:CatB-related O-acetyltransferase [Lacunisphaera sp.]HWA09189.1 CatB-related O-acetyltransferase [Opitutaceae bacterium]
MLKRVIAKAGWSCWRRILAQRQHSGFRASPFSFCNDGCTFADYVWLGRKVSLTDVSIGRFSYIISGAARNCSIGAFCSIGQEVKLGGLAAHPFHVSTHPSFFSDSPPVGISFHVMPGFRHFRRVEIHHDVWIGDRAMIMDGVKVGTGAVIGAGAIVTHDVAPYEIVAGVPARVIRKRVPEEAIDRLLQSEWWLWDLATLRAMAGRIGAPDVEAFLEQAENRKRGKE